MDASLGVAIRETSFLEISVANERKFVESIIAAKSNGMNLFFFIFFSFFLYHARFFPSFFAQMRNFVIQVFLIPHSPPSAVPDMLSAAVAQIFAASSCFVIFPYPFSVLIQVICGGFA